MGKVRFLQPGCPESSKGECMQSSQKAAVTAFLSDVAIAAAKFTAFFFTRSSGMLSEAIHSCVDAGNSSLLVLGLARSQQPPDETHPFGYGKEVYFWTLLVALFIFLVGGGFSLVEGIRRILDPHLIDHVLWQYLTLAVAAVFEGYSLHVGLREFRKSEGVAASWRTIHASKDPSTFTVIFEDAAALIGLSTAFVGTLLDQIFHWPLADGISSLIIGSVLLIVAVLLIVESKALLIGEGVNVDQLRAIRELALLQEGVVRVGYPMTMYFGPRDVLLTMNVRFGEDLRRDGIEQAVDRIEVAIRGRYPYIRHIYLEAESLRSGVAFDPNRLPVPEG